LYGGGGVCERQQGRDGGFAQKHRGFVGGGLVPVLAADVRKGLPFISRKPDHFSIILRNAQ
jgi:hypothetical protein